MIQQSLWRAESVSHPKAGPLPHEVDVVVVGAGITGLTAAYLLKQSGKRVAVFEREEIGAGETGQTSSHLTNVVDERLTDLAEKFGKDAARLAWKGNALAIDMIESMAERGIRCRFQRVPAYLCAPFGGKPDLDRERDSLQKETELANELGFAARLVERGPLTGRPAMQVADQAIFHPLEYLAGLAACIDGDGSVVREHCHVADVIDDPLAVNVNGELVACGDVVIATHVPIVGKRGLTGATLFQTKLYPYLTYVVGAVIDDQALMPGLYFDTSDPYFYLRVQSWPTPRYAIFGGCDHKPGQATGTEDRYRRVEEMLLALIPSAKVERRWAGEVVETADGLPYVGEVTPHQYAATGYGGNGLTFGTLAAMTIRDAIAGADNPWRELFDPNRKATSVSALRRLVSENIHYPMHYVADRLRTDDKSGVENVPKGGGKVIKIDGQRVAVHRTDAGDVVKVSAVCTHMGCLVRWNEAERTWDCPCHGSRFTPEGLVLDGPAESPLEKID